MYRDSVVLLSNMLLKEQWGLKVTVIYYLLTQYKYIKFSNGKFRDKKFSSDQQIS